MRPKASYATAACREMVYGDGTSDCIQRVIDLSRVAVGADEPTAALDALVRAHHLAARRREAKELRDYFAARKAEDDCDREHVLVVDAKQAALRG